MKNKVIRIIVLFVSIGTFGQQDVGKEVLQLFSAQLEKDAVKSGYLHVYSKSKGIDIRLAESTVGSEHAITINNPLYTASITKMLTATSIGILKDKKKIDFEDKIHFYLPESLVKDLHILDGKEYSKEITLAHLLQHRSGLPDYFTDTTRDKSPNVLNRLLIEVDKHWAPHELIQFTKEKMKPHFVPGQGYHYTDTEYVLLALIIERVSGLSLDRFFQQHIFQPQGMDDSYINLKSSPRNNGLPFTKFYVGEIEISSIKSLSADWGGGGLVSTTHDLIQFLKAYNEDRIVKKETRLAMQNWVEETAGIEYGFGIRKVSFKTLFDHHADIEVIGHTGSTASFLWYCPQLDTYITGTLNQLEASKSTLALVYGILTLID